MARPILWPKSVKKIVLLSATINEIDVHELGLDRHHDVVYHHCGSPIPPSVRPIYYQPHVNMAYKNKELSIPVLAECINAVLADKPESGIIHTTYADANALRPFLSNPRLLWHTHDNKQMVYNQFITGARNGRVLVGSGFTEGIDLKGDLARWQILTKVPSLSLADPAVAMKAQSDPGWYAWQSVKNLIQASGRVCRTPEDYGETYIFDSQFKRLYTDRRYLFPAWYQDSVRGIE